MKFPILAQCLCPKRHCILAAAFDPNDPGVDEQWAVESLRAIIATAIASDSDPADRELLKKLGIPPHLNPWCSLCGARWNTWSYEAHVTKAHDWETAVFQLRECESEQQKTAAGLRAAGLAYDAKRN